MVTRSEREFQTRGAGRASPGRSNSLPAATLPHPSYAQRLYSLDASPRMTRPKTALIVEGGGMRGAWAAGALAALWSEACLTFPAVQMLEEGCGVYAVEN